MARKTQPENPTEESANPLSKDEQIKNLEESLAALEGKDDAVSVSQRKAHSELLAQLKG